MKGKCTISFEGTNQNPNFIGSPIPRGPLKLPEGVRLYEGVLIAFGEDENYLHCVISSTGDYFGIYKSDDRGHLWQHVLELNSSIVEDSRNAP